MRRLMAGIALATALLLPGQVHAATLPATDVWLGFDAPTAGHVIVHWYVHSESGIGCGGGQIARLADGVVVGKFYGYGLSDKDGVVAMFGSMPARVQSGQYVASSRCSYAVVNGKQMSGQLSGAFYKTTFAWPVATQLPSPPPSLRTWISPQSPSLNAPITLYAQTDPGALCSAYTDESDGWASKGVRRAGKSGLVSFTWKYQMYKGTAYVTCDGHKMIARQSVDY